MQPTGNGLPTTTGAGISGLLSGLQSGLTNIGATSTTPTTNNTTTNNTPTVQQQTSSPNGQLISRAFDDQINNYNNIKNNSIPTYENLSNYNVNQDVNQQKDALAQQYSTGQSNHQLGQQALDLSHTNGVRDLGDQLRTSLAGYQNQLGVQGAGNSSAAGLLSYALQNQGQRGMNDLNDQYNHQQQSMDVAGNDLDQKYQIGKDQLERFRSDSLNSIAISYQQQKDAIDTALSQATGQKAIYLQNAGADLANQALQQMQQLESQLGNAHSTIDQTYQQAKNQNVGPDISQYVNGFGTTPLSTQQIQATSLQNNQPQNNQTNYNSPVSLQRRDITQPA